MWSIRLDQERKTEKMQYKKLHNLDSCTVFLNLEVKCVFMYFPS
jgi:hypothetical protein